MAGRLQYCITQWSLITSDIEILNAVNGFEITFTDVPKMLVPPKNIPLSESEMLIIDQKLIEMLHAGVITKAIHCRLEFISNIFVRPKQNGGYRLILNLSKINKFVEYNHFKMETLSTALELLEPNMFMASVDLKDAYYSVPIAKSDRKWLRFMWRSQLYEFTCLPNGLSCAPRIFTKILKPVFAVLRSAGLISVYYLDDILLFGSSRKNCLNNVTESINLLTKLGFTINYKKSILEPKQTINFLGFTISSVDMKIAITPEKSMKITSLGTNMLRRPSLSILTLASFIGVIVASLPGVLYGQMHYRAMERLKINSLKNNRYNYDAKIVLTDNAISEIKWWISHIQCSWKWVRTPAPDLIIYCDASLEGWGAVHGDQTTGGRWTTEESKCHINYLEIKAAMFAVKSLCGKSNNVHIRIMIDNTTAVHYVNNMGGTKSSMCDDIVRDLWEYASENHLWLSAGHIPGVNNFLADQASRKFDDTTEWSLNSDIFLEITKKFGTPDIDLFASRLNNKCPDYASWKPDPYASVINAFSINWNSYFFYAFPPFSMVSKCTQKILQNKAEGVLIVPLWAAQPWFPKLMKMLVKPPLLLPLDVISLPNKEGRHPLADKLRLLACRLSGNNASVKAFRETLPLSYWKPGENQPKFSMKFILKSGFISVMEGRSIPLHVMKLPC